MSTATPNAHNVAQSTSVAHPNDTITMPPIGPYHPVASKRTQLPAELSAADVKALSPGTRALVTDYTRAKLSPYTFCAYSLDLLGSISGVPPRYHDAVLAMNDKLGLFVTMQAAQKRLTPDQTARLTSQFLRGVTDH